MTAATRELRAIGWTAARLATDRQRVADWLSYDAAGQWRDMLEAVCAGERPRFTFVEVRDALRQSRILRDSPMARFARCRECDLLAAGCDCSDDGDGELRPYYCSVCGDLCSDGEDCCSPEEEENDDYTPPPAPDGYSRGPWERIERRDVEYQGMRHAFAPYFCGIELETDSTPTDHDWREIFGSSLILGAWHDGTVRGPEIVSQPARGYALARVVELFSNLHVSLTSKYARESQQCGMHIHVDCRQATPSTRVALVNLWMAVQDALWARPDMHLRRAGGYCGRLTRPEADQVVRVLTGADTYGNGYPSRYRDCNFAALSEHGTVELRIFGWPAIANDWGPAERAAYMWRCIRTTQGLRLAAKLVAESGLSEEHPIYNCDSETALALIESLIPACPVEGE